MAAPPTLWSRASSRTRLALGLLAYAAANAVAMWFSTRYLTGDDGVVVLCPAAGLAAGAMRITAPRLRPALVVAQLAGSMPGALVAGAGWSLATTVTVTAAAAACTYPLAHAALGGGAQPRPWEPRGAIRLLSSAAIAGLIAAPVELACSMLIGDLGESAWQALWTAFASVTTAVFLVAPVVTVLGRLRPHLFSGKRSYEALAWLSTVVVTATLAALGDPGLAFLPLAHVALAAVRLGPGGGAIASLLAATPFALALAAGDGGVMGGTGHAALLATCAFAVTMALVGWWVGLVVGDLAASRSALAAANVGLARSSDELRGAAANVAALLDAIPDVYVLIDEHGATSPPRGGDATLRGALMADEPALARLSAWPAPAGGTLELALAQDGAELVAEARGAALATGGRILLVRDVTERRRQQQELGAQALELERSNAELAQFAYVASHDLREPLRQVAGFAELLGRSYRGRLDATADEYIDLVLSGVTRMNSLIRDLLALSELRREAVRLEPCDLGAIVEAVVHDERRRLQEIGGTVQVDGELPVVAGDRTQLHQLVANLIGNAIKYRSTRPLFVRITAVVRDDRVFVHVADNGIGFEVAHASRIFGMFQRLHPRDVYEGTGIGLALCRRVVENHGGAIWADSAPSVGSTFTFTLRGRPVEARRVA